MRALKGGIVRVYRDGRSADARRSRVFQEAIGAEWGPVPAVARSLLREAARLNGELVHAGAELDMARQRGRRRDIARLRRSMVPMRGQLTKLLEQIETLAKQHRPRSSLAALLAVSAEESS
jgi:hypothetical protein